MAWRVLMNKFEGASRWDVLMPAQPAGGPHNLTIDQFAKV